MAFVHGKGATFKLDNSSGTLTTLTDYVDDVSMPRNIDTAEVTTLGDSDKSYIVGLRDATISVSGPWDATVDAHFEGLLGSTGTFTFNYSPDAGTTTYSGETIVTSYEVGSPVGDRVAWSADLQVTGAISRA